LSEKVFAESLSLCFAQFQSNHLTPGINLWPSHELVQALCQKGCMAGRLTFFHDLWSLYSISSRRNDITIYLI